MTYLYFARHGRTADNARRVFQGQSGGGLDAHGRAQAERLAARVASLALDAIVTSDLLRAVETARIVGAACGLDPALESALREVDVGAWSGKDHEEIAAQFPDEWMAWSRGIDVRRGGGETYAELAERVEAAALRTAVRYPRRRVLVVSHGGAIRSYVARLLGLSREGFRALGNIENTALTLVEIPVSGSSGSTVGSPSGDERPRLRFLNDASHLEGLEPPSEPRGPAATTHGGAPPKAE